jgi:hypothetical protein
MAQILDRAGTSARRNCLRAVSTRRSSREPTFDEQSTNDGLARDRARHAHGMAARRSRAEIASSVEPIDAFMRLGPRSRPNSEARRNGQ